MEGLKNFMSGPAMTIAVILLVLSVALVLFSAIKNVVSDFDGSKKGLFGLLAMAVLILIGYALASGTIPEGMQAIADKNNVGPKGYKAIGGIINTAVIATVAMIAFLIIDSVSSIIRK